MPCFVPMDDYYNREVAFARPWVPRRTCCCRRLGRSTPTFWRIRAIRRTGRCTRQTIFGEREKRLGRRSMGKIQQACKVLRIVTKLVLNPICFDLYVKCQIFVCFGRMRDLVACTVLANRYKIVLRSRLLGLSVTPIVLETLVPYLKPFKHNSQWITVRQVPYHQRCSSPGGDQLGCTHCLARSCSSRMACVTEPS